MADGPWIWNSNAWPALTYDSRSLDEPLRRARSECGRLFGMADAISVDERAQVERDVWSGEAVATAAIEGEVIALASVRSSVARRLGIDASLTASVPRQVEGLLDVMESAAADWDGELSAERLCRWQGALFPGGGTALRAIETGRFRTHGDPMQIVSGPLGHERVHYVAPPSATVADEMQHWLAWFNRTRDGSLDGVLRAGLAHVWFESIHPFEDGNGRVGRAVVDLALAQDVRRSTRLHGVSSELRQRQNDYYDALNRAQRGGGDVTEWLAWFVDVFTESCRTRALLIDESLVRARFWQAQRQVTLNERQRKVLNRMLEAGPGRFEGGLTPRKYVGMTGASSVTAWRDIDDLLGKGLLVRGAGAGRSTHYNLTLEGWGWMPTGSAFGRSGDRQT